MEPFKGALTEQQGTEWGTCSLRFRPFSNCFDEMRYTFPV